MKLRSIILLSVISFAGLSSCKSQKEIVEKTTLEHTAVANTTGVPYFKAVGTEPFWSIEISEKEVKYTSLENDKGFTFPNDNIEIFEEDKKTTFSTKTHMLIIEAISGECSDGMSDLAYSHKVVATLIDEMTNVASENYGCGQFSTNPALSGSWNLETFRNQVVNSKDFNGQIPSLDFIVETHMFSSFAGCNTINGQIIPNSKNRIKFANVSSTEMMCGSDSREQEFIITLSKVVGYKLDGEILTLLDSSYEPIATFQKK